MSLTRLWRPRQPVPVGAMLSVFRHGGGDPCYRSLPGGLGGSTVLWRATRTPDGPALLRLVSGPGGVEVAAVAWGAGAGWVLDGVPELLGDRDDPTGFEPRAEHPRLVAAWRAGSAWRVPRSRAVFESLVPAALEQRVTGKEGFGAWRALVLRYGEPAPGPADQAGRLRVPPAPADWLRIPSWVWLKAGVDEARRRVVLGAAAVSGRLEQTLELPAEEAARRLRSIPGVGVWTAAEVRQRAHGDPDAFSWGDYHVGKNVSWALTGQAQDDQACAQLIECYRGHRYRVQRLLELDGAARPRHGPRMTLPSHLP